MRWLRLAGQTAWMGRRGAWQLVLVLCAAVLLTTAMAAHAAAAPTPNPSAAASASAQQPAPSASSGSGASSPGGLRYSQTAEGKAASRKAQREAKESLRKKLAELGLGKNDLLDSFHITDDHGIPVSAYTVDAESGDWSDWDLKVYAWLTNLLFMGIKWLIAFACWLITYALGFKLAEALLKPALAVSDSLYSSVLLQMGLPGLFLVFSGVTAAWHWFFGDRSRGWGEITASLLISALAVTALASPPQMLLGTQNGAVGKARGLGIAVASIVMGGDDAGGVSDKDKLADIARPITDQMVTAFVVQPSMVLTYGQVFTDDDSKKCASRYVSSRIGKAFFDQKVAETAQKIKKLPSGGDILLPGVGGDIDNFVRDKAMQWGADTFGTKPDDQFEKSCVTGDAKELKKASADKLAAAAFMLLAAILVCVLIMALAGTYLATQAWLAAEAMLLRCALIAGTLPGPGRAWLWSRGAAIARGLALLIVLVVGLGVFVVAVTTVVSASPKDIPGGIIVRFVLIDIICVGAILFRKRLMRTSHQMAARIKGRVGASKLGGRAAPSDLGPVGGGRRGTLGKVVGAGLMLGAMAASGGTAGALGSGLGRAGSARALTGRLAQSAGRLARGAERTVRAGGRAGVRVGRIGLKSSVGLPVYGPRAAHRVAAAAQAVPGQVTSAATQLKDRLDNARSTYEPQVRDFADEYWRGIGGRWISNRVRARRGLPPLPFRPSGRSSRRTTGPLSPAARRAPNRPLNSAPTAAAPRRSRRQQMVPQRPLTPPASSQQASLQQRLHRIRTRAAAANRPITPPAPPCRQPPPSRPPRPGRRS
ncbi:hypothetical protein [Streptomyces sp. NPDC059122]|uniref:hypothetical protein n=1 Tax=Streptomyces sp. NPDC059122 TaxID=3346732 RepID=UPI00368AB428